MNQSITEYLYSLHCQNGIIFSNEDECYERILFKRDQMEALTTLNNLFDKLDERLTNNWIVLDEFSQKILHPSQSNAKEIEHISEFPTASSMLESVSKLLERLAGNAIFSLSCESFASSCWRKMGFDSLDLEQTFEFESNAVTLLGNLFPSLLRKIFIISSHNSQNYQTIQPLNFEVLGNDFDEKAIFLSIHSQYSAQAKQIFCKTVERIKEHFQDVSSLEVKKFFLPEYPTNVWHAKSCLSQGKDILESFDDFFKVKIQDYIQIRKEFCQKFNKIQFTSDKNFILALANHFKNKKSSLVNWNGDIHEGARILIWYLNSKKLAFIPMTIFGISLFRPSLQNHFYLLTSVYLEQTTSRENAIRWLLDERTLLRVKQSEFPFLQENGQLSPEGKIKLAMKNSNQMQVEFFLYQYVLVLVDFTWEVFPSRSQEVFDAIGKLIVEKCRIVNLFLLFYLRKKSPELFYRKFLRIIGAGIVKCPHCASTLGYILTLYQKLAKH